MSEQIIIIVIQALIQIGFVVAPATMTCTITPTAFDITFQADFKCGIRGGPVLLEAVGTVYSLDERGQRVYPNLITY